MNKTTEIAITATLEKRGIEESLWSAIKSSIFPGASDESALLAYDYCKARGLDIMKKPCHIVPMNVRDAKTGKYGWRDVIMSGIVEHRITAMRTGEYAGQDVPIFGPMIEIGFGGDKHFVPEFCTVTVYRMSRGERAPHPHTEYFEEACGTTKDGSLNSMWKRRKRGQLAKCAEAGALRKGFPEELGGLITADEATPDMRDATPKKSRIELREDYQPKEKVATESKLITKPVPTDDTSIAERKVEVISVERTEHGKKTRSSIRLLIGVKTIHAFTFSSRVGANAEYLLGQSAVAHIKHDANKNENKLIEIAELETSNDEGGIA